MHLVPIRSLDDIKLGDHIIHKGYVRHDAANLTGDNIIDLMKEAGFEVVSLTPNSPCRPPHHTVKDNSGYDFSVAALKGRTLYQETDVIPQASENYFLVVGKEEEKKRYLLTCDIT